MYFSDLQAAVVDCLRARVRNGHSTERSLARIVGISQPHLHNVLKGSRSLSPELSDQILYHLRLSLLDLVDRQVLEQYLRLDPPDVSEWVYLPVLRGKIGPGHPWPSAVETYERFRISSTAIAAKTHPVVARLGEDARMSPIFSEGDLALLDQGHRARTQVDANAYYLVKRGRAGLVRRVQFVGRACFIYSDDVAGQRDAWERLPVEEHPLAFFVRARVTLMPRESEWVAQRRI